MSDTQTPTESDTGAFARWRTRVLDGPHEWGSVEFTPTQHGVTRYRLVLFPPGIDTGERRLLRAWRAWSTWGAVLWLGTLIVLCPTLGPGTALAASSVTYLASGAVLCVRVGELRSRVRTLIVTRIAGYPDDESVVMFAELKSVVAALCAADARRDRGESSPAEHEAAWWQVYDHVGQLCPGPVTR